MALHAGFAAALSISKSALQQFLHAAYVNDIIRARYQGQQTMTNSAASPHFGYKLAYDFVSSELRAVLAPNDKELVQVQIELFGPMTFTAPGKPTVTCEVVVRATIGFPIVMELHKKSKTVQFGLDPTRIAPTDIDPFTVKLTSGTDPKATYGFNLSDLKAALWLALIGLDRKSFLFTPPLLDQVVKLGYTLSDPAVKITADSINLGIDLSGTKKVGGKVVSFGTSGDVTQLVNLNTTSTGKGWRKTFKEAIHDADDEYGEPLYITDWTATTKRQTGPHGTDIATVLNSKVLDEYWDRLGRHEVVKRFEDEKHATMLEAIKHLNRHHTYSLPELDRIVINRIEAKLINDYLSVEGEATRFGAPQITVGFSFKLRIVRADVDGITPFIINYQGVEGFTGEVLNVDIDQPDWVTVLEVLGAVAGVILAPFTSGISLIVTVLFELIVSSVVSALIGNAESQVGGSIADAMATEQGILRFTLPDTSGPTLVARPNDITVEATGVSAWFSLITEADAAHISVKGGPGYFQPSYAWPVTNTKPIVMVFDDADSLYNPSDSKVRIRWTIFAGDKGNKLQEVDLPLNVSSPSNAHPERITIDHASAELNTYERFIVQCRVYRPFGDATHELFQQETTIGIVDRLRRDHSYVRWNHEVHYQDYSAKVGEPGRQGLGWKTDKRLSKIHYTDPKKRCRFADQYSQDLDKDDLDYFDALPFPLADISHHRKRVCPYCFFGGPDKTELKP